MKKRDSEETEEIAENAVKWHLRHAKAHDETYIVSIIKCDWLLLIGSIVILFVTVILLWYAGNVAGIIPINLNKSDSKEDWECTEWKIVDYECVCDDSPCEAFFSHKEGCANTKVISRRDLSSTRCYEEDFFFYWHNRGFLVINENPPEKEIVDWKCTPVKECIKETLVRYPNA